MPPRRDPQRDLLVGLLAMQNGLADQPQVVAAFAAWTADGVRPMAEILAERGVVDASRRGLLEALADAHLKLHGGDTEKSLAAVAAGPEIRRSLDSLGDTNLTHSLARVSPPPTRADADPDATTAFAAGSSTSDGRRFRVLRPYAKGGLGTVSVALDAELNREVALKQILDHHADDPVSRQRFLLEAEITGGLEHPGIVPVYGLGSYEDGRPYYAMRFVRGDSLKEAIERFHADDSLKRHPGRRSLELRKLLRRFVDVCNAIDYAHGRGVLHRDIKPGNVIIGKYGETLVVDWGLAKPMGHAEPGSASKEERTLVPSSASGSADTLPGSALGTPSYMSPEQAAGDLDRLGPRSDVYSLGATLYCLLTGRAPMEGLDVPSALRAVRKGEFPTPRKVAPKTPRPLEAACLKAMALEPEDRYASPRALADDLERWMADEPVSAYPEPWTTRARRWVGRNRTKVVAGASVLIVATVALAALLAIQRRANRELEEAYWRELGERTRSNTRFTMATQAIEAFYTGVSGDVLLGEPQLVELRTKLLQTALNFYRLWQADLEKDPQFSENDRLLLCLSYERLAEIHSQLGMKVEAVKYYEKAMETYKSPDLAKESTFIQGKTLVKIARLLRQLGRSREASEAFRRSLLILEKYEGLESTIAGDLGWCLLNFASFLDEQGRPQEALRMLERARTISERRVRAEPNQAWLHQNLAVIHLTIGNIEVEDGRIEEARRSYEQALATCESIVAKDPAHKEFQSDLARCFNNLGYVETEANRPTEALEMLERGRRIREDLFAAQTLNVGFRSDLGRSYYYRARLRFRTGPAAEALADLKRAEELFQGLPVAVPEDRYYRACLLALHAQPIGPNPTSPSLEEQAERRRFADQAIDALKQAVDGGFRKRTTLEKDWIWNPLRTRDDFRALIRKLEDDAEAAPTDGEVKPGPKPSPG